MKDNIKKGIPEIKLNQGIWEIEVAVNRLLDISAHREKMKSIQWKIKVIVN